MIEHAPHEEPIVHSNEGISTLSEDEGMEAVQHFDSLAGFPEVNLPPEADVLEHLKNKDPELAALVESGQASLIPETVE